MVEMENSRCDQDVHHKQLQAARGSRVCVYGRLRIRVLSVGRASERKVSTVCWFDCRMENDLSIVNERIEKFLEYKKMPIEERINRMKSVYGDIIPKNEMAHEPFTYVRMYG